MSKLSLDIVVSKPELMPAYGSLDAAAFDLKADVEENAVVVSPGEVLTFSLGIKSSIPKGYAAFLYPRSGLGSKGIRPNNCVGVIDSDYRGEWKCALRNDSPISFTVNHGDRLIQAVVKKVEQVDFNVVDSLDETTRGEGGFGSTGVR